MLSDIKQRSAIEKTHFIVRHLSLNLCILGLLFTSFGCSDPANNPDEDADVDSIDSDTEDSDVSHDSDSPDADDADEITDSEIEDSGDSDECLCSTGPCCDGCNFLSSETRCDDSALSYEYRCQSSECGADPERRGLFRHCSGISEECTEDVLRQGDWEPIDDCSESQTCVFSKDGVPYCYNCDEGCEEGECLEPQCTSGQCCEDSHFLPATTQCNDTPEERECRCSSGECGADIECRESFRYCTGASDECGTTNIQWDEWVLTEECDEVCETEDGSSSCVSCEYGCSLGSCVIPECTSGVCCDIDAGRFRDDSFSCDSWTEYQCTTAECGGEAQERTIEQMCSGSSETCDGSVRTPDWETVETCSELQVCESDPDGSLCVESAFCSDPNWREVIAVAPPGRSSHILAYDSAREVTVLFGGWNGTREFNDTWEYDGTSWTEVRTATRPSSRTNPGMTYDSSREVTVLFGGSSDDDDRDTWEYDGTDWTRYRTATRPTYRYGHAMVFDRSREVIVLFGGDEPGALSLSNETWEYDGTDWELITTATVPMARRVHSMVYDNDRELVVLFGGEPRRGGVGAGLSDTWEYDGIDWTERELATDPPARRFPAMSYHSVRRVTLLFGGQLVPDAYRDTWEYNGSSWTLMEPDTSPPSLYAAKMAYDASRGISVHFGGINSSSYRDWTWEYGSW